MAGEDLTPLTPDRWVGKDPLERMRDMTLFQFGTTDVARLVDFAASRKPGRRLSLADARFGPVVRQASPMTAMTGDRNSPAPYALTMAVCFETDCAPGSARDLIIVHPFKMGGGWSFQTYAAFSTPTGWRYCRSDIIRNQMPTCYGLRAPPRPLSAQDQAGLSRTIDARYSQLERAFEQGRPARPGSPAWIAANVKCEYVQFQVINDYNKPEIKGRFECGL